MKLGEIHQQRLKKEKWSKEKVVKFFYIIEARRWAFRGHAILLVCRFAVSK